MFYAMNKLRRSTYLCTPSGNRKQGKSLVCAQFVRSLHFFLTPQKGAVKKLSLFYSSIEYLPIQVKIIVVQVATAGTIVVVKKL